jgi:hypothetical protein
MHRVNLTNAKGSYKLVRAGCLDHTTFCYSCLHLSIGGYKQLITEYSKLEEVSVLSSGAHAVGSQEVRRDVLYITLTLMLRGE